MHIDRNPSTILTVIDRIYHPIAQNLGVSLLMRNEINSEIQFPPRFFINLIQITGNLVANAITFTSPNGFVDVVFNMGAEKGYSTLKMTVTDTGKIISPELVAAINQRKQVATLKESGVEESFGTRLDYVMQLISEEGGRIYVKSENECGTTFSLSLPLQNNNMTRMNGYHNNFKNGEVYLNGSHGARRFTYS